MSITTSMEVGEYKSFSIKIIEAFEQDIFKNLVIEMFGEDDYLISIVTYKHDFVDGPYKLLEKEVLEGTFDQFMEEDGVTARCSYQLFIVSIEYEWCNGIIKDEIISYDFSVTCQGGGFGPSNGGTTPHGGLYSGNGNSAYSPNVVYLNAEQLINTLKPMAKSKFNNLYPSARNSIIAYINQNLNYPIRLGNVTGFINGLGDIENAQTYSFFNQLVNGHYIPEHNSIKSEIVTYLGMNHYHLDVQPFVFEVTKRIHQHPTVFTSIRPFLIEKQIDDSLLDPCPKGVFQQVKTSTNCDFAQVLAKLGADSSLYSVKIKSQVPPNGKPAQTLWNSPYNYTTYISTNYPGKTKLYIATLQFHELVHAYFMSLFDDYYNTNPPNLNAYNDFASLYHYYVILNHPSSINAADIHHQQMATDYADAIARALQEYQTGIPVPDTMSPNQIYTDLAYGSLQDAPVFDALFPVGNPNRQRIINRYIAEQTGNPTGQGTADQQNPIGQPCN